MSKLKAVSVMMIVAMYASPSFARVNTLTNTDEISDGDKKICIYEGSGRVETIVIEASRACPSKKTFH